MATEYKIENRNLYIYLEDEHIEMHLADCDRDFDYYEAEIRVGEEQYKYHFEIISDQGYRI